MALSSKRRGGGKIPPPRRYSCRLTSFMLLFIEYGYTERSRYIFLFDYNHVISAEYKILSAVHTHVLKSDTERKLPAVVIVVGNDIAIFTHIE